MTKEQFKAILEDVFKVAKFVASLTKKTSVDDVVIIVLEGIATQDWALELLLKLINGDLTPKQVEDAVACLK